MSLALRQIPIQIPAKLLPVLEPRRFKVLHGGRGGAKSHSVAQILLAMGARRKLRILCVREVQKSLAESSMQVLKDYIDKMGLADFYTVLKTEIRGSNGTTFSFAGLRDHTADSIKSWEGADIVWVEEAHSVSAHSWMILIPTIRKAGSEIWATYNPNQVDDYVHDRFVVKGDPDALVIEINWRDNPWFGPEMNAERMKLQAVNDDLYNHVWEGQCRSTAGLMFKRRWFRYFDSLPEVNIYLSSDYAVTEDGGDWTEHGIAGLDADGDLYFFDWWSGQTEPEEWIRAAMGLIKKHSPMIWFDENGVIRRSQNAAIEKSMRTNKAFVYREGVTSAGNKAERALGFAARASVGSVWLPDPKVFPEHAEWVERLVNQLCAFTGEDGRVDDMVDVCSQLARGLDRMQVAIPEKKEREKPVIPFSREHIESTERLRAREARDNQRYYRT